MESPGNNRDDTQPVDAQPGESQPGESQPGGGGSDNPQRLWTDSYVDQMHALLGRDVCRPLAIFKLPANFCLSVIVPVFNESATITLVIKRLRKTGLPLQIILVDDGSDDGTATAVDRYQNDPDIKVIHHAENRGKGAAVRTGAAAATGDVIVIQTRSMIPTTFDTCCSR